MTDPEMQATMGRLFDDPRFSISYRRQLGLPRHLPHGKRHLEVRNDRRFCAWLRRAGFNPWTALSSLPQWNALRQTCLPPGG